MHTREAFACSHTSAIFVPAVRACSRASSTFRYVPETHSHINAPHPSNTNFLSWLACHVFFSWSDVFMLVSRKRCTFSNVHHLSPLSVLTSQQTLDDEALSPPHHNPRPPNTACRKHRFLLLFVELRTHATHICHAEPSLAGSCLLRLCIHRPSVTAQQQSTEGLLPSSSSHQQSHLCTVNTVGPLS